MKYLNLVRNKAKSLKVALKKDDSKKLESEYFDGMLAFLELHFSFIGKMVYKCGGKNRYSLSPTDFEKKQMPLFFTKDLYQKCEIAYINQCAESLKAKVVATSLINDSKKSSTNELLLAYLKEIKTTLDQWIEKQ